MTMDMTMDKVTLLEEYSDEITRVIARMYEEVQLKQEETYYKDVENGVDENEAWSNPSQEIYAGQLNILMRLMVKLDETFPEYMATSCIMMEEGLIN